MKTGTFLKNYVIWMISIKNYLFLFQMKFHYPLYLEGSVICPPPSWTSRKTQMGEFWPNQAYAGGGSWPEWEGSLLTLEARKAPPLTLPFLNHAGLTGHHLGSSRNFGVSVYLAFERFLFCLLCMGRFASLELDWRYGTSYLVNW